MSTPTRAFSPSISRTLKLVGVVPAFLFFSSRALIFRALVWACDLRWAASLISASICAWVRTREAGRFANQFSISFFSKIRPRVMEKLEPGGSLANGSAASVALEVPAIELAVEVEEDCEPANVSRRTPRQKCLCQSGKGRIGDWLLVVEGKRGGTSGISSQPLLKIG
ncbi:hypothetical protein VTK26DRAFT_7739 [Humicola hyalothermophila]